MPGPDYGIQLAFEELACALALCRRHEGLQPLGIAMSGILPSSAFFRAANQDEGLVGALHATELIRRLDAPAEKDDVGRFLHIGLALACLGEPLTTLELQTGIESVEGGDGSLPERLKLVQEGIRLGRAELSGQFEGWKPDEDTRLGAWFEQFASPSVLLQPPAQPLQGRSGSLALWKFFGTEVQLSRSASALETRCTPLLRDEPPSLGFARLGLGGLSELRFHFRLDPEEQRKVLRFRFQYQKGRRSWLPYSGEAAVIVTFDDQTQRVSAGDESVYEVDLFLFPRRGTPDGSHVVSLRLEDSSTTTFRVYEAEILLPQE